MRWVRNALVRIFGWAAKRLFNFALLLRLFSLVLEREAARSAGPAAAADDAQRRIDEGAAWLDFCDSLRGLVHFVLEQPPPPLQPPQPQPLEAPPQAVAASGAAAVCGTSRRSQRRQEGEEDGEEEGEEGRRPSVSWGAAAVNVDALDRREGLRYLTRVMRGGLEAFMDCWDPAWPVLRPLPYNVKLGADNPDNLYMYGTVSGGYEYRLYGTRGSVTYLSFGVYTGSRPGQGSSRSIHLDSSQLLTRPDGSFEVFLTQQPRGDNWMALASDSSRLVVRQTFLDRGVEVAAQVHIERLPLTQRTRPQRRTGDDQETPVRAAPAAAPPSCVVGASGAASGVLVDAAGGELKPPLSAGQVVSGLAGAAVFIAGSVRQFQSWSRSFAAQPNTLRTLDADVYASAWADPAIHFFHGYWALGPREALLIQVTPPDCPYWNFQLDNWWMESLDYVAHPETTTNKATASYMPDGSICLLVAHSDPRVAAGAGDDTADPRVPSARGGAAGNEEGDVSGEECLAALLPLRLLAGVTWISTAHHRHGTMGLRWVLAQSHPVPRCRVVSLGRPLAEAIREGVRAGGGGGEAGGS